MARINRTVQAVILKSERCCRVANRNFLPVYSVSFLFFFFSYCFEKNIGRIGLPGRHSSFEFLRLSDIGVRGYVGEIE